MNGMRDRVTRRFAGSGFTMTELVISAAVLLIVIASVQRIFFAGIRGAQHSQETADQVRVAAILFRALEEDISTVFVTPGQGKPQSPPILISPPPTINNSTLDTMEFSKLYSTAEGDSVHRVTYKFLHSPAASGKFLPPPGKIVREEKADGGGKFKKSEVFGADMVDDFKIHPTKGDRNLLRSVITLRGQAKKSNSYVRFFRIPRENLATTTLGWEFQSR